MRAAIAVAVLGVASLCLAESVVISVKASNGGVVKVGNIKATAGDVHVEVQDEQRAEIRVISDDLARLDEMYEEQQALCRRVDREISRLGDGCNEYGPHLSNLCLELGRHRTHWGARCER